MPIDILLVVFRFALFGLLIYKIAQLSKSFAIPMLKEELEQERKYRTELLEKEKMLISTQHRLETQIDLQKKTFNVLEMNVQIWNNNLLQQKEQGEREAQCIFKNTEAKRKIQTTNVALAKDGEQAITLTCNEVSDHLRKELNSDTGAQELHAFIAKLVSTKQKTF